MSNNEQQKPAAHREVSEISHDYLVECVQLLEDYTAQMLQMILHHHPYMGPAANAIGQTFQERHAEIEARYPKSQLIVPPGTILKPH